MANSAGYELDCRREIIESIREDTSSFIMDSAQEVCGCVQGKFILAAAGILVPDTGELQSTFKSNAFSSGATTILMAFYASDQTPEVINKVQKNPIMSGVPANLLSKFPENTELAFNIESARGLKAHPEIKDHLDFIAQYFVEITQDPEYASYVYIGGGFYARRLDLSFDAVMDQAVSKWFNEDLKQIDWDTQAAKLMDGYR